MCESSLSVYNTLMEPELKEYLDRLNTVLNDAAIRVEKETGKSASLRKLAALTGNMQRFNTLYKWNARLIKSPIRNSSLIFLSDIDSLSRPDGKAGRTPLELAAYLHGSETNQSEAASGTAEELISALLVENARLKKQKQQILSVLVA